jgi:hypothetical protein
MPIPRVAYDRKTGRPVGAAVNNSCHIKELEDPLDKELSGVEDPNYHPIQAIHHQLRQQNPKCIGPIFWQFLLRTNPGQLSVLYLYLYHVPCPVPVT